MDQTEQKPWKKTGTRKGIIISFSVFLLFSAVLLLIYALSVANVGTSDALTGQAAMERVGDAYDAVKFSLSLLPNASINYSINGMSSFILTQTMPAQAIDGSSGDFLALKSFAENYSPTNISVNITSDFPLPLLIDPLNMTVIQNSTRIVFQPLDNSSGTAVTSYTIDMTIDSSTAPTIAWNPLNSVSMYSSDAVFIETLIRAAGGPSNDTIVYINRSKFNRLIFTHNGANIMNATFDGTSLIGGLDISTLPSPSIEQRLVNNVFLTNDSNWTKVQGAKSNITWANSGRTGGSENFTLNAVRTTNTNDILQNVSVAAIPDFANVSWCYNVSAFTNNGSTNNISIFIKSPTNSSPGTLIDLVNLTGLTTDFVCRNAAINGTFFATADNYTFLARLVLVTNLTAGAAAGNITVLLDDIYWNFTRKYSTNLTITMNQPLNITEAQLLVNNVFLTNDSNWTKVKGDKSNITWANSGRTGGSERFTLTTTKTTNTNDILQNVSVAAIPDFANVSWCYNVSAFTNNGSTNNISIFIKSPTNSSPGTLIDRVNLTGLTTDFVCRNAAINGTFFASTGNYTFMARLVMVTNPTAGGNITVLLDDFYWNMTSIRGTPRMNESSVIDRVTGGVVPSDIAVSVRDEFKKTITNG